jgi:hypothetical protein
MTSRPRILSQPSDNGTCGSKYEPYLNLPVDDLHARLRALVNDPDADTLAWFHAALVDRFPAAFADTCIRLGLAEAFGVDRAYLETIGAALHAAAVVRGRHDDSTRSKAARILLAEARRLVRMVWRGSNPRADQFFLELVWSLWCEYQRAPGAGVWPNLKYARAFGWVLGAIRQYRGLGRPYDLDAIIQRAAEALRRHEGISVTDVRTAVMLFTRRIPLDDWLAPIPTPK